MSTKIFVLGPAGSGKSTFSSAFKDWMGNNSYLANVVNMDPGADFLPYDPDVDIRDYIILSDIMDEYSLGPNGAQILAADMVVNYVDDILNRAEENDPDYIIFDTPGQIELFAFRTSSEILFDKLSGKNGFLIFLMDPMIAQTPSGYISLIMLSASVYFRFYSPFLNVINKMDLLSDEDLTRLNMWNLKREILYEDLRNEGKGMESLYFTEIFKALDSMGNLAGYSFVSSRDMNGFEKIYTVIQSVYGAGEDLEKR